MGIAEERWRPVAPLPGEFAPGDPLSLLNVAYFAGQRTGTLPQLRAQISLRQLQQIALGVMQFVQDYDAQFRFKNEFWRDAIRPYTGTNAIFQIPGTRDFYTFNDNLSDRNIADVRESARTVQFYEGQNQKPQFRYGGKAAIGFADGHAALVSPDEADDLSWKP